MIHDSILSTIGRTPVVRLHRMAPANIELYVKLESFNPGGSVKDRMALGVIEAAERDGSLTPGQTVIEATSGNSGIALAMVCARRGYPFVAVMAENFSIERRKLMRFMGARVVLTPASERGSGMLAKASELAERHGWFMTRQFENEANAAIHARTTAIEIAETFAEGGLDYWVTGTGTGGTLKGVASVLRTRLPGARVVVAEPDNAPVLSSGVNQTFAVDGRPQVPHPVFRPHLMQGWTPDFIPGLVRDATDAALIDELVPVNGARALQVARELAASEGILAGITGGATLAAALDLVERAPSGSRILAMLPDTGERYMSTPLFAEVPSEMTEEEITLSRSTPGYRFDATPATAAPSLAPTPAQAEPWAEDFVKQTIRRPVVMFALEWCEFCWAVRRMFRHFGIEFHSVDLDSVAFQAGDRGGAIRHALGNRTGIRTIPQIFVDGQFVGGSTDLFAAWRSGKVQPLLKNAGVNVRDDVVTDPAAFLPGWLHPRQ